MEDMELDEDIPLGHGASAFGSNSGNEEDDFIPLRPVLNLLPYGSIHIGRHIEKCASPALSYNSMGSDNMELEDTDSEFFEEHLPKTRVHLDREDSISSHSSLSSNDGEDVVKKSEQKVHEKTSRAESDIPLKPELQKEPNEKRHPAFTIEFTFKLLQTTLQKLKTHDLNFFKKMLWERYPECFKEPLNCPEIHDLVDRILKCCDFEVALKVTKVVLGQMGIRHLVEYLDGICKRNEVRYDLKEILKRKYSTISERFGQQGEQVPFDSVFTEPYITSGFLATINSEHEVIPKFEELVEDRRAKNKEISYNDIFDPKVLEEKYITSVLMRGVAGIGKSVIVQKFILDWVEGRTHSEIFFILPMPFCELRRVEDTAMTFLDLVYKFHPVMKTIDCLDFEDCQVLFILDGLEDYADMLDFRKTEYLSDVSSKNKVGVLMTNLIKGNMLYSAYVWITSRPIVGNQVPPERVHQLIEVRGFKGEQKETFFRKRHTNTAFAEQIIKHVKANRTLDIMCHMPIFCSVVSTVLQREFQNLPPGKELSNTLTGLYTYLLMVYIRMYCQWQQQSGRKTEEVIQLVTKLGKMAYHMLEKGAFEISRENWKEYNLDKEEVIVRAGLCTEFFKEKFIMYQEKVHSFIHPTVQEYLAALYVFLSFRNQNKNVVETRRLSMVKSYLAPSLSDLHKNAVDKMLHCKSGHFDLFLRFLLGLSVDSNQQLLRSFITGTGSTGSLKETMHYIRKKTKETSSPERAENLVKCLAELSPGIKP
ncbi:protein NLRC3 [Denticeps clupeoides]|uniref:FISNA domain-containing protein n=1 Tax=Denticeps clupeoides TaxID=299321 RepID=A0AAY4A9H9_9TELE|nr:protein NLRC3-like [Denticeps clupeoides]XP_028839665.1 protein NLRC3-like [Denticeps clupeoides]XP_028839666.1 protein NLRC3-like [Denticeps clupeoides]XP_028839667.1 protein NLRC3-like [Denticeps clupeoides]XP_028839668.1 protein NLRC3-like [Denticeps clupeoides]XP_028839669.1 protein NLRC3-like [Denticeps clupeoides]XP_028839670.1 protein NLRC3-like [Denticeps clupeoides]